MNKKFLKQIVCILICFVLLFSFSEIVFAGNSWDPISEINGVSNGQVKKAGNRAIEIFGSIINVMQLIGMGIAIIVLVIVAIQYVVASPKEKAEIKNKSTNFIIGAVLMFSAAAVLQIVKMFIDTNVNNEII